MATIIKTHPAQSTTPAAPLESGSPVRAVTFNLADMAAQASDYLDEVRREAAKIVDQARREAAAVRQEAENAGRRAAEQAIERILDEKVAKQMKTLTPALQAAVKQIQDSKQQWLGHWERSAVNLAVDIAGRLVQGGLSGRPEITVEWTRQALELAAGCGEICIRLHPSDEQTAARQIQLLATAMCPLAKVQIIADETLSPGGCRVVTEFGVIDQQLETQLQRVKEELA